MEALKQKLEAFQRSRVGLFFQKFQDDQATNLAALLAWGTLSTLLPLLLGVLGLAGLVLRDPERLDQIYSTLLSVVPSQATGPMTDTLDSLRKNSAGAAGIVGIVLLLFNGSKFFSNMASVFNQAYHVENRNLVLHNLFAILMLVITTTLLVLSTTALGLGSALGALPFLEAGQVVLGRVISWSVSILSAALVFLLLYKILPNAKQGWRDVLPGTLAATVLFFAIMLLFPLYTSFFPPNQAYAAFGLFLLFTFWLYLLGMVFVMGAEVNAFIQQPARSVALAEATRQAQVGKAQVAQERGEVAAEAVGTAPSLGEAHATSVNPEQPDRGAEAHQPDRSDQRPRPAKQGGGIVGSLLGLVGMIAAAVLLRGKQGEAPSKPASQQTPA